MLRSYFILMVFCKNFLPLTYAFHCAATQSRKEKSEDELSPISNEHLVLLLLIYTSHVADFET